MTAQNKWLAFACLALIFVGCDDDGGDDGAGGAMDAGGAMAGGAMAGGDMAGGAMPGGDMAGGAMPGGAMPGGMMGTGGDAMGGMMSAGGAMPECVEASDCAEGEECVDGGCEEAACVCGEIYMPVCGEDGMTYDNACTAMCADVAVVSDGECGDPGACEEAADCGPPDEGCDFHCIENACVPNCGEACENDDGCLPGQTCDRGRCAGVPDCPDPADVNVTYTSMDPAQCAELELVCPPGQDIFNDHCGCGCQGERMGGECECPPGGALVCGVDDMTYQSACEAECVDVRVAYDGPCRQEECEELMCELECPMGFARDENGCPICACDMPGGICDEFYYSTCQNDQECRDGYVCNATMQDCVPSDCQCSPDDDMVVCTNDCIMDVGLCSICPVGLPLDECQGNFAP